MAEIQDPEGQWKRLTKQTKGVILRVHEYLRKYNGSLEEAEREKETAAATGVSIDSLKRLMREQKRNRASMSTSSPPKKGRPYNGRTADQLHKKGEKPTLDTILRYVKEPPLIFQGQKSTFRALLKEMDIKFKNNQQ